jgi:hypothetical protein
MVPRRLVKDVGAPMEAVRRRQVRWLVTLGVLVSYLCIYGVMRSDTVLVHRMSYSGLVTPPFRHHHWVEEGPSRGLTSQVCSLLCTPLRWSESAFWHLCPRTYDLRSGHRADGKGIWLPGQSSTGNQQTSSVDARASCGTP